MAGSLYGQLADLEAEYQMLQTKLSEARRRVRDTTFSEVLLGNLTQLKQ